MYALVGDVKKLFPFLCRYSPVGILFLIAAEIINMDNLEQELARLSWYMATVILGLLTHALITLPLLMVVLGRRNPIKYTYGMLQALMTAFGTSSRCRHSGI